MIADHSPAGRVIAATRSPARLTVVYDAECALCVRCRHWLEHQPTHLPVDFMAAASDEARERYGEHLPWIGFELVVVSDRGEAWIGPAAFLMCLWATEEYRDWSFRLSGPFWAPLAESFFHQISTRRKDLARFVRPARCDDGRCRHRG